jgi:hypothetical protein
MGLHKLLPFDPKGKWKANNDGRCRNTKGLRKIIDLIAIARAFDDPVGPMEPSAAFLRKVQKRYPGVPSDISPQKHD